MADPWGSPLSWGPFLCGDPGCGTLVLSTLAFGAQPVGPCLPLAVAFLSLPVLLSCRAFPPASLHACTHVYTHAHMCLHMYMHVHTCALLSWYRGAVSEAWLKPSRLLPGHWNEVTVARGPGLPGSSAALEG